MAILSLSVCGLLVSPAVAQEAGQDETQALEANSALAKQAPPATPAALIALGKRAHGLGKYGFAIQAFKQAQRGAHRPRLSFLIARAYEQRFRSRAAAYDQLQASAYFQRFLESRPAEPERSHAQRALASLALKPALMSDAQMARAATAEAAVTRLVVVLAAETVAATGADVRIDGGRTAQAPLFTTIAPGEHTVEVAAAGFLTESLKVTTTKGTLALVQADLAPEPAKLGVTTSVGASVHVDGRFVGVAPLDEPIDVGPGPRRIAIALNGHRLHTREVIFKRGVTEEVTADLTMTRQRIGATILLASGGAGLVTGIVCGATSVGLAMEAANGAEADRPALVQTSEELRGVSAIAAGVGFGLLLSGGLLFVFDEPNIALSPQGPGTAGARMRIGF